MTDNFCVNISCEFLLIQQIYFDVTYRCTQKWNCPGSFHITYSSSDWSNEAIVTNYFNKIIFPYLEKKCKDLKLEKNAKGLLILDVFMGQTKNAANELLQKNDIAVIHLPNNHTNLFQPLDVSVNKRTKCYLSSRYQCLLAENVLE